MNTTEKMLIAINAWLKDNDKTKAWLAQEMRVDRTLVSKILSGERQLTAKRMSQIVEITGIDLSNLLKEPNTDYQELTYSLRGNFSTRKSQSEFNKLLHAVKSYVKLGDQLPSEDIQ